MLRNTLIILIFVPTFVLAETQSWVCLASFQDEGDAQEYRASLTYEFVEELSVVEADTALGRYYRVLLGPFDGVGAAQRALEDARRNRPDAWIVTAADDELSFRTDYDSDVDYDYDPYVDTDTGYQAPVIGRRTPSGPAVDAPEPMDTAPPGYDTHRLRRQAGPDD